MSSKPNPSPRVIHVMSDATGNLGSHMVNSVLTQFPGESFEVKHHFFVRSSKDVEEHLAPLRGEGNLVLHRLLVPRHKQLVARICRERGIPEFDLTGGLVTFLEAQTGLKAANDPERLHRVDEDYFRRIQAMEFTAQHDDNRRLDSAHEADIVIVGLSRVSKSPTSTWLGFMGYKVANVAVSPETGFPGELDRVRDRTVALTTRPKHLWEIRRRRFEGFHDKISEKIWNSYHIMI